MLMAKLREEIDGVKYRLLNIKLAPDDDAVNRRSEKEYNEKVAKLAALAAKLPVF